MSTININLLKLDDTVEQVFELELYDNDTKSILIDRISYLLGTIKDYIEFDETNDSNYSVHSLIHDLKSYVYDVETLEKFLKSLLNRYKNVDFENILIFLYYYNEKFKDFDEEDIYNLNLVIYPSIDIISNLDLDIKFNLEYFLKNRKTKIIDDFNEKFFILENKIKKYVSNYKIYNNLDEMKVDLKTKKNKSILKIKTNILESDYSLNTIFASIVCNEDVPFSSFSGIFKLYDGFSNVNNVKDLNLKDYEISSNLIKMITLKIKLDSEYINCYINFQDNILYFALQIDYTILKTDELLQEVKDKILKSFPLITIEIIDEQEVSIIQTTIITNKTFYHYVMSDIIMNNPFFSEFMAVEESTKSSKTKSGLFINFFIKDINGKCNVSIIDDLSSFPVVKSIRLRIKTVDLYNAEKFIVMFKKLLTLYEKEEDNIIEIYRKYIKDFPEVKVEKDKKKKLTLSDQVPDLFLKTEGGYARRCQNPPVIVDEKEASNYKKDHVMKYPIKGEGVSHYYACKEDEYNYVGLRENTMKNKDVYKYIPCCYKESQLYKKNYRRYYYDEDSDDKSAQQNIIKTNKFAQAGEFALVPKNIKDLFDSLDLYDNNKFKYIRMGVNDTSISFLECVLESIDFRVDNILFRNMKKELKLKYLELEYKKLINYDNIAVASQENPGLSEHEMKLKLSKRESYMDPRHWIKLVETIYQCKIIIFYRKKKDNNVMLSIPNHEMLYLEEKPLHKKLVLLYEHYGNEIVVEYPRCEIVMASENSQNIKLKQGLTYYYVDDNYNKIINFYSKQIEQFYYSFTDYKLQKIKYFDNSYLYNLQPISQIIDNYGKCRGLFCNDILILCDPIPPLNLPSYKENYYIDFDLEKVNSFIKKYDIKIIEKSTSEIKIQYVTMKFIIKIKNSIVNEKDKCLSYPCVNNFIKDLNYLYRLSFILSEYFIYYYSLYVTENDLDISLNSIKDFIKNKVVINDKNNYNIPNNPKLSIENLLKNNFIDKNLFFIVDHQETLKRIVYILRARIINNFKSVMDYHKNNEIYDFYKDINYYKSSSTNIIVQDLSYLDITDNNIYNELVPNKQNYFFSNSKINNGKPIYLKEYDNKSEAFFASSKWIQKKDFNSEAFPLYNTELFLYKSKDKIKVNRNVKRKNEEIAKAIKYRTKGKYHYMAIAELK